ncbi:bifunctional metallophosphatase/5'-nucleotidase [Bacteroides sp. OttesenSCG-928-J23]|nr:bifunctional metallophosphatase/5'-nucleotidase [Bacteroides sp. OttesenSCG-928-J23]
MKSVNLLSPILCLLLLLSCSSEKDITVKLYHTTDMHGNYFPHDFIKNTNNKGSLARVSTFMKEKREEYGSKVLFIDGGDVLQGQPTVYYYNFIDTIALHSCARVMNYLNYDVATVGNHDIETGHSVYDRWIAQCDFPVLGANVIDVDKDRPYFTPYYTCQKGGLKIAVIGMVTEAIPAWLPENLWAGLRFDNIQLTAQKWIPYIREKEKPDILIALIHSGVKSTGDLTGYIENEGLELAKTVPGIDVVLCGHDHSLFCEKVANAEGDSVLIVDPGAWGTYISDVTIKVKKKGSKILSKNVSGDVVNIATIEPDQEFVNHFDDIYQATQQYVDEEIGEFTCAISAKESFFGPSAYNDLLHTLQLKLTGADVSFVAPLSQTAFIDSGKVYMRDMFNLYRYENLLYTMKLTGQEIKDAMEYFYGLSTNKMTSPNDHLLLIEPGERGGRYRFIHPSFSFDTAAGIIYTVDASKSKGKRIEIHSMADASPFDLNKTYMVAINSYQGCGGGGILTEGAGISKEELKERIVNSTNKDLRYHLAKEIRKKKVITPKPLNHWKFIPEKWTIEAAKRDYKLLFGE